MCTMLNSMNSNSYKNSKYSMTKKIANHDLGNELSNANYEHIKIGLDQSYNYCDFFSFTHFLHYSTEANF